MSQIPSNPNQPPYNPQSQPFPFQSGYPPAQQDYQMPQPPVAPPKKKRGKGLIIGAIVLIAAIALCGIINTATSHGAATTTATTVPTKAAIPTATPQSVHYPPTNVSDLHGLAAKGDANAIHGFHSESVGLTGACPQPKRLVTVDPSVTGQKLAEDLLAYFYAEHLDNPCGSIVFVYHQQAEVNDPNTGGTYTAGLMRLDVTDSTGANNVDPNATNLKHSLTLDIGGLGSNKEYVVTY